MWRWLGRLGPSLLLACGLLAPEAVAQTVRVGIYDNNPKVFRDAAGRPQGIFVDVLEAIAAAEGWELAYQAMSWPEAYDALRAGELDLLVDVARTPEREVEVAFPAVQVLDSWIECYARRELGPLRLKDLSGRRVAVLEGSVQETYLRTLAAMPGLFSAPITVLSRPSYAAVARAVLDGEADVLFASSFYAFSPERPVELEPKRIVLHPNGLYLAAAPGDPRGLTARIDAQMAVLKNDPSSAYYRSLERWLVTHRPRLLPVWLSLSLGVLAGGLVLSGAWTVLLRRQVRLQTGQLAARNAQLVTSNRDLDAALAAARRAAEDEQRALQRLAVAQRLEALGRLTGGVIHDFRNVQGVVIASLELALLDAPADARMRRHLERGRDAADRATAMVDQLLAFTRREPLGAQVIELNEALRERRAMLQLLVGSAIVLDCQLSQMPLPVRLDPVHLDQILLNLVGNAREAISGGGGITIRSAAMDLDAVSWHGVDLLPGRYAELVVSDTGSGIPEADLARIQEPFFTTKAERGGTGLGLATVVSIIDEAGGALWITSPQGEGTTVRVVLPLVAEARQSS